MRNLIVGIALIALLAAIWAVTTTSRHTDSRTQPDVAKATPEVGPSPPAFQAAAKERGSENSGVERYARALHLANDYWEFASAVIEAARGGDRVAEYYLARSLQYCDDGYRMYFIRGSKRRTLDEALQWASTRPATSTQEVQEVFDRCERLEQASDHPFGDAAEWLGKSANAGYDLAMLDSAQALVRKAGVSGNVEDVAARREAKRLALAALRERRPETIFRMGDLATLIAGEGQSADEVQWVWRLAGCQRGYDCSKDAEWLKFQCRFDLNCQPQDDGIDFIRRNNSANFDELQQRARELSEKLDEGKFEDLVG